jgi:hypothetical protein
VTLNIVTLQTRFPIAFACDTTLNEQLQDGGTVMKKIFSGYLCLFVLCSANLFAQDGSSYAPRVVHTAEKSTIHTPAAEEPSLVKIYSNLGPPATAYNGAFGFLLAGPNAAYGQEFLGYAFIPKADSTVTVIQAALQYLSGDNQINLSLYTDAGGLPGTIIAGPNTVKNLPDAGTCCALATWRLRKGTSIFAGVQYWVVVDTPATGTGSNTAALWDIPFPTIPEAVDQGGEWFPSDGNGRYGVAVLGTVP